jgi:hypothetical protein
LKDDREKLNGDCCAPRTAFSRRFSHREFDEVKRAAKRLSRTVRASAKFIVAARLCNNGARERLMNSTLLRSLAQQLPRGGGAYCHFLPSQKGLGG